jgi:hypothetical protein
MDARPRLLPSLEALTDAATLTEVIGRVDDVRITPLTGIGYSNAALSRVETTAAGAPGRKFILKRTRLGQDWTARQTGDHRGREALLLTDPELAPVWEVFACPYVAFARAPGEIGMLLNDVSAELLPDARTPLSDEQEISLLTCLARLHSRFWGPRAPTIEWLVRPGQYCDMLAPSIVTDAKAVARLSPTLQVDVPRGWRSALSRVPSRVARHLTCPGTEWERRWADIPRTLLHGDAKVANFAMLKDGRVAAFDWAVTGVGPCTIDLGWYLAVNASRLTGPKDQVVSRYRALLERALGKQLGDPLWDRLEDVAVVCGARMLLWSKAIGLDAGRPGAHHEWNWWVERLADIPVI